MSYNGRVCYDVGKGSGVTSDQTENSKVQSK